MKHKTSHSKSNKQSGGVQTWSSVMANGIRDASKNFRVRHKWYRIGALSSLFYAEAIKNQLALNRLIEAIDDRCQKMGIYLKEVSSKDFDELEINTRLIFIKQDLKEQTTYGTLLNNITSGKMDEDFKKYYASFRYTKLANHKEDGDIFRQSIPKKERQKYKQTYTIDEVMNDIADKPPKRSKSKRRSAPKQRPVYHARPEIVFTKAKNSIRPRHYKEHTKRRRHHKHHKHSKHRKHHKTKNHKKKERKRATRSKSFFMKRVA